MTATCSSTQSHHLQNGLFDDEASPESGRWLYETGTREFQGFQGNHISVPCDVRILVSPEYVSWYWLA